LKNRIWVFFQIFFTIILGSIIYLLFRPKEIVLFRIIDLFELTEGVQNLRNLFLPIKKILPTWVIFSLPNALWVYSMSVFFIYIWQNNPIEKKLWLRLSWSAAVGFEVLQLFKLIPGTFSFLDLAFILIACLLSKILN
jgi:hypothetical protein